MWAEVKKKQWPSCFKLMCCITLLSTIKKILSIFYLYLYPFLLCSKVYDKWIIVYKALAPVQAWWSSWLILLILLSQNFRQITFKNLNVFHPTLGGTTTAWGRRLQTAPKSVLWLLKTPCMASYRLHFSYNALNMQSDVSVSPLSLS